MDEKDEVFLANLKGTEELGLSDEEFESLMAILEKLGNERVPFTNRFCRAPQ
jgi:hypothetical protein